MKTLKIKFVDFWNGFDSNDNFIINSLHKNFKLDLVDDNPDLLICSNFGYTHFKYDTTKIHYTGENIAPDFNIYDFAIGHHNLTYGDRYIRWPFWRTTQDIENKIINRKKLCANDVIHKKFCNFIYSNASADPIRDKFYHKLSEAKKVESLGRHLKNTEVAFTPRKHSDWQSGKIDILKNYKFTICFENSLVNGYTTEKLIDAYIGESIPIYWGNPALEDQINKKSFIRIHSENTFSESIKKIIEISEDTEKYIKIANEPLFTNQKLPHKLTDAYLDDFLKNVGHHAIQKKRYVSKFGTMKNHYENQKFLATKKPRKNSIAKKLRNLFT